MCISQGASENSLFHPPKIYLATSIYGNLWAITSTVSYNVLYYFQTGGIRDICLQEKNSHSEVISSPEVEQCRKRQKTETVTWLLR